MPSPAAQSKENLKKSFCVYSESSNKIPNTLIFFLSFHLGSKHILAYFAQL